MSRIRALWSGTTGTGAAASIGLALLVFACTFVGVAVPRASLGGQTDALQRIFSNAGPAGRTVAGTADPTSFDDSPVNAGTLAVFRDSIASVLRQSGLPLAGRAADWSALTVASDEVRGTTATAAQMELAYRDALPQDARLVSGSLPDNYTDKHNYVTFEVAVTQATAKAFGLHVGSVLTLPVTGTGLRVTGIVRPIAVTSAFWTTDPLLAAPEHAQFGAAFVGPDELAEIVSIYPSANIGISWGFPLILSHVSADQAPALQNKLAVAFGRSQAGPLSGVTLSSDLVAPLAAFISADDQITAVLALLFVSLTAIGLIVILLGARLLSEYRAAEFTVLQARGASVRQVAWLALRGGALVAIPAAIVAVVAAMALTPGAAPLLQWQLTAVTLAVALAGPPAITARRHQALRGRRRASSQRGRGSRGRAARRWVFDIAMICAAAGGLLVLRQLRPPAGGGLNFFTSAAPVLVAIPAAIIVMRVYPVALRWLLRLAGRRGGVTIFVGLARGARTAVSSALPIFALVLALTLIGFGATLHGAIERGEVLASWQLTGADAVIQEPSGSTLSPALQRSIAAVPGVQRTATEFATTGSTPLNPSVPVVEVSPAQYAALVAGTSAPAFPAKLLAKPAGGKPVVPVLVTPGAASLLSGGQLATGGQTLNIRVVGTVPGLAGQAGGSEFIVVPAWSVAAVQPNVMAVVGARLNDRLLTRLIARIPAPAPGLELRANVLRSLQKAPLPRSGYVAFAQGAAAAGGFCVLILLLSMVLGARSRRMTLIRLTTMGMSRAQARRLSIVETVPAIVAAALGGAACVVALVPLLAPAISLAAFTGSPESVPVRDDPAVLAASVGALLLLALLTIVIQAALAGRRQASSLRVGE
jgi:putative ABC transport system permease protein